MTKLEEKLIELGYKQNLLMPYLYYKDMNICMIYADLNKDRTQCKLQLNGIEPINDDEEFNSLFQAYNTMKKDLEELKMGYRYYLGIINKKDLEDINQLTFEYECDKLEAYENKCRYVFELGKLWSINSDAIYEKIQETKQVLLKDEECYICSQQIFLELANVYKSIVVNNFKETYDKLKSIDLDNLTKEQKTEITELIMECRSKWGHLQNAEFKDKLHLTYFYEHEMFALMHLHLTTDFENEVIICFAY